MVMVDSIHAIGSSSASHGSISTRRQRVATRSFKLSTKVQHGPSFLPRRGAFPNRCLLHPRGTSDDNNAETSNTASPPPPGSSAPARQASSSSSGSPEADPDKAAVEAIWQAFKRDAQKSLGENEAKVLDSLKVDDVMGEGGDLMAKIAEEQLGPLLRSLDIAEEPLAFFTDLLRTATALQLLSAGALFYGAELGAGCDAGEALRCVCGLALGYLSRPFLRVELLLAPLYDWVLQRVAPGAVYEVSSSPEDAQAVLSQLGVAVAGACLLPRLLWGWEEGELLQLVLPLAGGWVLFDVMYCAALLAKLSR
ncbi:hypothetical protein Agub_g15426 [Astrephomene gubernaculifera]|uniref:Uncharacterized protein n=1 Tax=Astrephomene gubernaculifera TaxID=47775 RepID=A0AAD3HT29_9CHLO|nr:hypothetical protein Agub_g15426 [Astrephomene gubernaculifera]